MLRLLAVVMCLGICGLVAADTLIYKQCEGMTDGSHQIDCVRYLNCTGGNGEVKSCTDGQVFNNKTGECDEQHNVPPPCGVWKDCSNKEDGRYADLDRHCRFFYLCNRGYFLRHEHCPEPLVFDEELEVCNWMFAVSPPCGSYIGIPDGSVVGK